MNPKGSEGSPPAEHLPGNVGGAMRIGDRVHRDTGPWTPAVHALLDYLGSRIGNVPNVHGLDSSGPEVLAYLPGEVIDLDTEILSVRRLASVVTWTRRFHEAAAGFSPPGPWRYFALPDPTFIGHNDLGPYNMCFHGQTLAGVFDWDLAGPTNALNELAFLAWNCVPLWTPQSPDVVATRLQTIADAYSGPTASEILDAVPRRIEVMIGGIPEAAAAGDRGMQSLMRIGEPERSARSLDALMSRMPEVRRELAGA